MDISTLKELPHKKEVDANDWDNVSQSLRIIMYEFVNYAEVHNKPVLVTRIIAPEIPGISKSKTHSEKRAVDISSKDWTIEEGHNCERFLNDLLAEKLGAISFSDGLPRVCVYHNAGLKLHFHLQTRFKPDTIKKT